MVKPLQASDDPSTEPLEKRFLAKHVSHVGDQAPQEATARVDPAAQDHDCKTSRVASGFKQTCMGFILRLPVRALVLFESGCSISFIKFLYT